MTQSNTSAIPLRLRALPILVTTVLGLAVPYLAVYLGILSHRWLHTPARRGPVLPWLYMQHGLQLGIALLVIAVLKRWVPADYGLHLPRQKSYLLPSLLGGSLFGIIMTLVDYAPQLLTHMKPDLGFEPTPTNVAGWLCFEGLYVGPTEEIPFRSLLVTYLATSMPGQVRLGRFSMSWAGVVVALIFALLHATNFTVHAWPVALGQQLYAFMLGVLYAYWLEKSRSVLAPIVGHNVSDVVEYLIVFAWRA